MRKVIKAILQVIVKSYEIKQEHDASAHNVWMQETTRW